ncbi:uncharacterized protein [Arachis hypogaea]|uniref:uncharacterized protein n=1 Tax=Arachis hypogaea TaxID=3818 RepID=UPI003B20B716
MKYHADKQRCQVELEEGDLALVKLQPYRQHSMALRKHQKLGMRYFGPFKIQQKLNAVAYKLALPPEAKIHNVFHISALKKFRGDQETHYLPFPLRTTEMGPVLEPHAVRAKRTVIKDGKEILQLQVQWGEGPVAELTWEVVDNFCRAFPDFNLEDKVDVVLGGNVTNISGFGHVKEGHATHSELVTNQGPRRSTRVKATNRRLENYVG